MSDKKNVMISELEDRIKAGYEVFLFDSKDAELMKLLCIGSKKQNNRKIEIWHSLDSEMKSGHIRYISRYEMEEILDMYRLYDFSDKFTVISESSQFGSLFNYLKTGVLTKEEMAEALLYTDKR